MKSAWIAGGIVFLLIVVLATAYVRDQKPLEEAGSIKVTFCPECEDTMATLIKGGGEIDCALYDVGKEMGSLLAAAGADVITDSDTKPAYGELQKRKFDDRGLMHNKFCIFNQSVVFTGSYNPTDNGDKNINNVLVIESVRLARNYEAELEYLKSGGRRSKIIHDGMISGVRVENYFCPRDNCETHVLKVLASAKTEVKFLTYSFTSDPIGKLLSQKQNAGVVVEGICDPSQLNDFTECKKLGAKNWDGPGLLHHKVFIIDRSIVVTGSYNPTANGNENNNENILIIHDQSIANQFLEEYNRLDASSNL